MLVHRARRNGVITPEPTRAWYLWPETASEVISKCKLFMVGVRTGPVANACYAPSRTKCAHAGPRNLLMLATPMCLEAKYLICAKRKLITFTST